MEYPDDLREKIESDIRLTGEILERHRGLAEGKLVALDWAGIGDSLCFTRLMLQHLMAKRKILWITRPIVAGLFKDDPLMEVVPGFKFEYRDPSIPWAVGKAIPEIDRKFRNCFPDNERLHVGMCVADHFLHRGGVTTNLADFFFEACGVQRDFSMRHSLVHLGKTPLDGKYVVIEPQGVSCGWLSLDECSLLSQKLSKLGIGIVSLGGDSCPEVPGVVAKRGLSLYDSFSIVKGAVGFVGKSSGNQALMCFLGGSGIPLFEAPCGSGASHASYRTYDKVIPVTDAFSDQVFSYYQDGGKR